MGNAEYATLVAALIAVAGAAVVFAAGEVTKIVSAVRERQRVAIDRVLETLAEVPRDLMRKKKHQDANSVDMESSVALSRLINCMPRRDWVVLTWLLQENTKLLASRDHTERTEISATATAVLIVWLIDRRKGRATARRKLLEMGITHDLGGRGIS